MWFQIFLLGATLYALYTLLKPRRPRNFPPGLPAYPIIGSIPDLMKLHPTIPVALTMMGEVFGPVSSLYMGRTRAIAVNGWEAVKEVLNKDEFSGRPDILLFRDQQLKSTLGIIFVTNNALWKTQRRFTLRRLRDWGFGKMTLEGLIQEEIQENFEEMDEKVHKNGGIVSIADAFGISVINILWAVIAGKRFSHDDGKLKELLRRINEFFRSQSQANNFINEYPFLRHLPYFSADWQKLMAIRTQTRDFIQEAIDEHINTRDPLNPRDFLDDFLHEMEKEKESANTTFFRDQLVALVLDIFSAGADSTSNTIAFALLYMILYPEVQEKVYREIQEVVGSDRLPSFEDRARMHYTEAVLLELLRYSTIAPQAVPHYTTADTNLNGYDIPKDTLVFVSLDSVNFDKKVWGDPENFRPERYLDREGKFVKPEQTVQFGLGKRVCIGYSLARMNYFLMFTSMIQRYRLGVVPGQAKPSTEPLPGFTFAPKPFSALLTPRNL